MLLGPSRPRVRGEHGLNCLVAQQVMAIALGYEELDDQDQLRDDSVLALAVGCGDVTGLHYLVSECSPIQCQWG